MRRYLSLFVLIAILTSLAGCVVVPDGGYYYGPAWGWHHHHDWDDRGWGDHDWRGHR